MAVYKVIQDIESEDKLVGPLTLRQFVYAAIAGALIFINFRLLISADLGIIRWVFIFLFSLPMILFGVLASPLGGDQPTELWLLSHLKFLLSARKRIWNQSGQVNSVTITAPKNTQRNLTKNITQGEVQSRLKALANVLDSRGWAIQSTPQYEAPAQAFDEGDRLVGSDVLPQEAQPVAEQAGDDLLDEKNSQTAQRYGALVREVEEKKKQQLQAKMETAKAEPAKTKVSPSQPIWDIEAIGAPKTSGGGKIIAPTEDGLETSINDFNEPDQPSLDDRLKAAEAGLRKDHPDFTPASPLTAERQRRAEQKLASRNADLTASGGFSVATLSTLANRNQQGVPL